MKAFDYDLELNDSILTSSVVIKIERVLKYYLIDETK